MQRNDEACAQRNRAPALAQDSSGRLSLYQEKVRESDQSKKHQSTRINHLVFLLMIIHSLTCFSEQML
jgi:hypothetical protein